MKITHTDDSLLTHHVLDEITFLGLDELPTVININGEDKSADDITIEYNPDTNKVKYKMPDLSMKDEITVILK